MSSKDSVRAARAAAKAAENKSAESETVVVKVNEEDSQRHAEFMRSVTSKLEELFGKNEALEKETSSTKTFVNEKFEELLDENKQLKKETKTSISNLKKSVDSNAEEIDRLIKRVDALGTANDYKSYIDDEISKGFESQKSYIDAQIKKRLDEKEPEPPKRKASSTPEPKEVSPRRTIRERVGEITESVKYYDGRNAVNTVVGEVIEEHIYY